MKRLLILLAFIFVPTCHGTSYAQRCEADGTELARLSPAIVGGGVPAAAGNGTITYVNGGTEYLSSDVVAPYEISAAAFNTTLGNTIVVWTQVNTSGGNNVTGVSDTYSNSYSKIGGPWDGYGNYWHECWLANNITGGDDNIVKATFTASAVDLFIIAVQYSGVNDTNPVDTAYDPGCVQDSSSPYETAADSTGYDNSVIVGYIGNNINTTTFTNGSGTLRITEDAGIGTPIVAVCDRTTTTAGSYSIGLAGGNVNSHDCLAIALRE